MTTAAGIQTSPESRVFWDGLRQEKLVLPFCRQCRRPHFPPLPGCPYCGSPGPFDQTEVPAQGRIYSWTVAYYAFWPEMKDEVPYIVVTVTLDAGPRMYGRMTGVPLDADLTDMPVRMIFSHGPKLTLPYFAPRQET